MYMLAGQNYVKRPAQRLENRVNQSLWLALSKAGFEQPKGEQLAAGHRREAYGGLAPSPLPLLPSYFCLLTFHP